jgi:hypothetical protein
MRILTVRTFANGFAAAIMLMPPAIALHAEGAADTGGVRAAAFRMIRGQTFVTATFDGGWNAEFAIAATGASCTVRRDLAARVWPVEEGAPSKEATLTIGDLVLRRVTCEVGPTNTLSLSRLGWDVSYDYAARQLLLRPARQARAEIGRPTRSK